MGDSTETLIWRDRRGARHRHTATVVRSVTIAVRAGRAIATAAIVAATDQRCRYDSYNKKRFHVRIPVNFYGPKVPGFEPQLNAGLARLRHRCEFRHKHGRQLTQLPH